MQILWQNPTKKTIYVTVNYRPTGSDEEFQTRYVTSSEEAVKVKARGMKSGLYDIEYTVEDFYGNKTESVKLAEPVEVMTEIELPKYEDKEDLSREYIWELVPNLTTLKNSYGSDNWNILCNGGTNEAIFDGVINSNKDGSTRSYTSVSKGTYDGRFPFDTDQMEVVIDLGDTYVISRIKSWQRAYWFGWQDYAAIWDDSSGTSWDYLYYYRDNLKTFRLYGTPSLDQEFTTIQECDIASPTMITDNEYGSDGSGWYPKASDAWAGPKHTVTRPSDDDYQRALDGHEWELEKLSSPVRYIKIRYVANFNMTQHDNCHGISELTLYGAKATEESSIQE